ncbi:MAG: HAD-IA family hydrolase [Myxococcota bacterium]
MSAFRALLLDFGGVCLFSPVELHHLTERHLGLPAGTFSWRGPFDVSTDALYRAMLAGELTEREYWHQRARDVGQAAGRELSLRDYFEICYDGTEDEILRPGTVALAEKARAVGLKTGILTNDLEAFHGPEFKGKFTGFFGAMATYVDASITGVLKPDPRSYQAALEGLGLPAEEVLFVDDQPRNIEGAEALGMPTVFFDLADVEGSLARAEAALLGKDA